MIARKQSRPLQAADLGLEVQWLTAEEAKKFGAKLTDGVIVTTVKPSSPAAQRGIKPGDVITSVNQERTFSPAQFREALQGTELKKGVRLDLSSGDTQRSETLKATDN